MSALTLLRHIFEPENPIAYKDGHLCAACESVVEASLASRRTAIVAAEFTDRRGPA